MSHTASRSGNDEPFGICLIASPSGKIVGIDPAASHLLGTSSCRAIGQPFAEIAPALGKWVDEFLAGSAPTDSTTRELIGSDDSATPAELQLHRLVGQHGEQIVLLLQEMSGGNSDFSEYRDPLTGLADRRALAEQVRRWQRAKPSGELRFCLLFLDLDAFKEINDRYGHAVGDQILQKLAQRWERSLRDSDLVVRYGGDEFIVLIPGPTKEDARPVVERLLEATQEPIHMNEMKLQLSVSIGIASYSGRSPDLDDLLSAADRDMYRRKAAKHNK